MKWPFLIDKLYSSSLSKENIIAVLNHLDTEESFGGLNVVNYKKNITESGFLLQKESIGSDGFTSVQSPLINGAFVGEQPHLRLKIKLRPSYFPILLLLTIGIISIFGGISGPEMTINGIERAPTAMERLLFICIGVGMPWSWCYFVYIRPIKHAEKWIVNKLSLSQIEESR